MDRDEQLWQLEKQFWLGDAAFYERTLAPQALVVLPPPVGVLERTATIDSIRSGARWRDVSFSDRHLAPVAQDTVALAYAARADRGGGEAVYVARCSSVYVRGDRSWCLALHHQTPVGSGCLASEPHIGS